MFHHTSAWLLRFLTVAEILTITGIVFGAGTLLLLRMTRARGNANARQQVFDNLLMQVKLARHPPIKSETANVDSKVPS